MSTVVVIHSVTDRTKQLIADALEGAAEAIYLSELDDSARAAALRGADAVLAHSTKDLHPGEAALLTGVRLLQFLTAGIDFVPLADVPPNVPVASNGGAYAEPMAEHVLAMALAAAKRLLIEHAALARGEFNQFAHNRMLAGATAGILGFGGIGIATARKMRALGMRIYAINRHGRSDETTHWIGTPDQLDTLLSAADVLVISTPLTPTTQGMIGAAQLARMKPDAILVNVARGEIVDEPALFQHLQTHPQFTACIDAWWIEPIRHGAFRMDHPFLTLPNVIGSPHNSASAIAGSGEAGLRHAIANIRRVLSGEPPLHLVPPEDRLM